ncbi:MAG: hypothetical protein CVU66_02375 [Deltaproteobacteria bacterium HGW-Deltaproteobacteria-23]|nr:MAG: hypothetical protein CVU66_02375 [Deltaproteobacteria bacterium HGW-Deltaproteobacteria-23]
MKMNRSIMTISALLGSTQVAHAASTTTIYSSGWLVLAFFGLCALVVTFQLIPALIMMAGLVKGLLSNNAKVTVSRLS